MRTHVLRPGDGEILLVSNDGKTDKPWTEPWSMPMSMP